MGGLRGMYGRARKRFFSRRLPADVGKEFEKLFQDRTDPWNYTSSYEQTKYERTLALLPTGADSALEIGCAEGHFTIQLAPRVKSLIACDISETALQRAASRCGNFAHVRFVRLNIANDPLPVRADLVVCSEMLYYVGSFDRLRKVARNIALALNDHGYLVMAHMNLLVDDPQQTGFDWQLPFGGRVIGEVFQNISLLRLRKEIRTPLYRIQLFQRVSRLQRWVEPRKSEQIFLDERPQDLAPDVANHVHWKS